LSATDWLLWQLADSGFPAGGFAHSGGVEAAWKHGALADGPSLEAWAMAQLTSTARSMAPFLVAAGRMPERVGQWDSLLDATLSNHVANRASRAQGRAFLRAMAATAVHPRLERLMALARTDVLAGHFAPMLGAACEAVNIELEDAVRLFLFMTLRGLISAAVRLGIVGPMQAQAVQWRLTPAAEALVAPALASTPDDAAQTAPMLDLMQGTQDRLYSRLFQS